MNAYYPKLIAGVVLFVVIGLLAGIAVGMLFFIATLPMVALFPEPSSAPQMALIFSVLIGFAVACVISALGAGAWKKRVEADLYREHTPVYVPPAPPSRALPPAPPTQRHVNQR